MLSLSQIGGTCSGQLYLTLAPSWSCHRPPPPPLTSAIQCALTKQGQRFLTKLAANARDPKVTNKLISKFLTSNTKSIALTTLSYLLSPDAITLPHLSSLAFPLYSKIAEASWFEWNPKLAAALVALLDKQGLHNQSEALISETILKLGSKEREIALFHCQLVEAHSKQGSKHGFDSSYTYLHQLLHSSSSVYVKRRAFESMVSGLCTMDRPHEADNLIEDMRVKGLKASVFEFRSVVYGYGRSGLFEEMLKVVFQMENQGFSIDTICSNMVLSSYGAQNELAAMVVWLQKMTSLSVPFSIRTYNSVLNSCPTIMAMLQESNAVPVPCSIEELNGVLKGDEALVVKELVESAVLEEVLVWESLEAKLDLHGMHLGSAYLILLMWFEAMKHRFNCGKYETPAEVVVVCGLGKHSSVRGESPVKGLVKEMMHRTGSPMRIDRKNVGCFVAKGRAVKDWLC